ncbi:MAG: 1-deoxy-D-xylulose-5-phosphate reductoisomerase [Planctomycetaceae bacterium]|nr:1-deoxy-D-xylulose-5-phosphate reductoisomerase [Planctomycetaceae bacterium]
MTSQSDCLSVIVLGSTGSIGTSCLDVIRSHRGSMRLCGAVARSNAGVLVEQAVEFRPDWVSLSDAAARVRLRQELPAGIRIPASEEDLEQEIAGDSADVVVSAIVGAAGLRPTLAAVEAGKRVGLANKETLVMAGGLVTERAAANGARILPVDSEHSAIFQALQAGRRQDVRRIVLTASGGPFRGWTAAGMRDVTPEMALKHPTWEMGRKISIDSATMMNKALEIIEARWLFDLSPDQIAVVIHPQSVVHSFVEFRDGSVISQMSPPDMRLPIQYALTFPERWECPSPDTDWGTVQTLEFHPPDPDAFPALGLGFEVAGCGGSAGAVLNAANEVAVERFLNHEIRFDQITQICREVLHHHQHDARPTLDGILAADNRARKEAARWT